MESNKITPEQRDELIEAVGVLVSSVLTRRMLRKRGASAWQAFAAASALTSLALLNRNIEKLTKAIKESQ
jgi:hypothetical protein